MPAPLQQSCRLVTTHPRWHHVLVSEWRRFGLLRWFDPIFVWFRARIIQNRNSWSSCRALVFAFWFYLPAPYVIFADLLSGHKMQSGQGENRFWNGILIHRCNKVRCQIGGGLKDGGEGCHSSKVKKYEGWNPSPSSELPLHATDNKRVQPPSVWPHRLVRCFFALCAVSPLQAHSQTQVWIPACFERSRSASKSSENPTIAATRHISYSIGWDCSQGKVCRFWNMLLRCVSIRNPIHLGAYGCVCVVVGLCWYHDVVLRPTTHLTRLSYPILIRIWPSSRIACCGCHDSVVEHWLYGVLYRYDSVVYDLTEIKCIQTCVNSTTHDSSAY